MSEDIKFVSSSSVRAQKMSIFDIFSLLRRSSSVADPLRTIVLSSFLDNSLHFCLFESTSFIL